MCCLWSIFLSLQYVQTYCNVISLFCGQKQSPSTIYAHLQYSNCKNETLHLAYHLLRLLYAITILYIIGQSFDIQHVLILLIRHCMTIICHITYHSFDEFVSLAISGRHWGQTHTYECSKILSRSMICRHSGVSEYTQEIAKNSLEEIIRTVPFTYLVPALPGFFCPLGEQGFRVSIPLLHLMTPSTCIS